MTAIAITAYGTVTGTSSELVAAAANLFAEIPQQSRARADRVAELITAVRTPLDVLL
jgi:hypothetical protein